MNVMKMAYAEPRPFWTDPNMKQAEISCSKEFGNPSGHSLLAASIAFAVCADAIRYTSKTRMLAIEHFFCVLVASAYIFCLGYSRIALAVHSWN